jgi:hypothetical protein
VKAILFLALSSSIAFADDLVDHTTCEQVFRQERACTDAFIPALVDLRAKLDKPYGIKAKVASNRDDVIKQAKEEWKHDSSDAAIAQTCKKAPADTQAMACLAKTACDAFVACIMPVVEKNLHR